MVASASGSVRTVEAVSTVLLRMLLLNESPGEAITAPAAYWDVRDGKYYCESDTPRARELFRKVNFPTECQDIPSDDFASNDRIAMAASKSRGRNQPIKASIDKRALDFNYAAGY
uniref:FGE-sulfatase domain-containing protein n=1 Tax=Heterorhabditis bacteriophora TaxID=37862 RepID=A0A1I7XUV3_HETBA